MLHGKIKKIVFLNAHDFNSLTMLNKRTYIKFYKSSNIKKNIIIIITKFKVKTWQIVMASV